jgi:hypothetical protein
MPMKYHVTQYSLYRNPSNLDYFYSTKSNKSIVNSPKFNNTHTSLSDILKFYMLPHPYMFEW